MDRATFPWLSIWIEPRATIREIIASDPRRGVTAIAASVGALGFLTLGLLERANLSISFTNRVLLIGTILAAPAAVILLNLEAVLCAVSGWALDGDGTIAQARAAIAWSWTPFLWLCLIAIPILDRVRISKVAFMAGEVMLVHTRAGRFSDHGVAGFREQLRCRRQVCRGDRGFLRVEGGGGAIDDVRGDDGGGAGGALRARRGLSAGAGDRKDGRGVAGDAYAWAER